MVKKSPFRDTITKIVVATDYEYIKTKQVPIGQIWCFQGIAYENQTGARGTFRRYIEGRGENLQLAEHTSPGAGELVFTDKIVYLVAGERLVVRQASCSANDILKLYVHGYIIFSQFLEE